jgi:hypothetical protein
VPLAHKDLLEQAVPLAAQARQVPLAQLVQEQQAQQAPKVILV